MVAHRCELPWGRLRLAFGLLILALAMLVPAFAASSVKADVLVDQYGPKAPRTGSYAVAAHNFANETYAEGADDFSVPAATTWDVSQVEVQGFYYTSGIPALSVNVQIYADAGGLPGPIVASRLGNSFTGNPNEGDFRVGFSTVTLGPGTYWISVQPNFDHANNANAWFWSLTTGAHGNGAATRRLDSQCGAGNVWFRLSQQPQCYSNPTGTDLTFVLAGSIKYDLTYSKAGTAGGTVTSNPAGISSTGATQTARYTKGQPVDLTAVPDSTNTIVDWTGCDVESGRVCTVSMNSSRSVQANFGPAKSLTVRARGGGTGTIDSDPTRVNCGCTTQPTLYRFAERSTVTIKAHPDSGNIVTSMTGCDAIVNRSTCTVQMNATKSVEVTFERSKSVILKRTGTGTGTITTSPDRGNCDPTECRQSTLFNFQADTTAVLHAAASDGSVFTGWTGCDSVSEADCTLQMTATKNVFPDFDLDADGDGIGDTTDQCPSVAGLASNGGCPLIVTPPIVNPPVTRPDDVPLGGDDPVACEHARSALDKAKSKLKKAKSGDASKKKIDQAKEKVKKAKEKVKKVC